MPDHKPKTCSRGHEYTRSKDQPVCPKCWPGYYKKKAMDAIPKDEVNTLND